MKKNLILSVGLLCAVLVIAGCTNPFARKQKLTNPTPKSLADTLAVQSQMRSFSSPEELKKFFENRPNTAPIANAGRSESVLGLGVAKDSAAPQAATGLGGGGGGFSTTNIQVAGVDESDIVKTDGTYIYTVSDKKIAIVLATPVKDAAIISEISAEGRPQELYIDKDKLIVFGYEEIVYTDMMPSFRPMASSTFLSVYDIADKANPKIIKNLKFEGNYTTSRLIDGRVYFISTNYSFYPTNDILLPAVYENGEKISGNASTNRYVYPTVYYIDTPSAYSATTVSVIDLAKLDQPLYSNVYFMPSGQALYASQGNVYLTYAKYISDYELRMTISREMITNKLSDKDRSRIEQIAAIDSSILTDEEKASKINQIIENYLYRLPQNEQESVMKELNDEFTRRYESLYKQMETTVIHKIALDNGALRYVGAGEVSGHLLNQFSMDEDKGYFRVATTRGQSWFIPFPMIAAKMIAPQDTAKDSYNNVFVLNEAMKTVGTLENLAKGERIYSVRFMGDRAYVVTFKQTDPLFVIDLANPASPSVIGEVKLPGFSNYLHPYGENVLIGIGKEATDKGDQGVDIGGLKISLFNVADPAAPKEITSLVIGGRGSDSQALYDHKAFLFSADKQLLVVPANITKPGSQDYALQFQGALVFRISPDTIVERGRIGAQNANEPIQRSLYIDDYLYSLSQSALQINKLDTLEKIKAITLPVAAVSGNGGVPMPLSTPAEPAIR